MIIITALFSLLIYECARYGGLIGGLIQHSICDVLAILIIMALLLYVMYVYKFFEDSLVIALSACIIVLCGIMMYN